MAGQPPLLVRFLASIVPLAIIENDLECPLRGVGIDRFEMGAAKAWRLGIQKERASIAVENPLRIAIRRPATGAFGGLRYIDADIVFGGVLINHRVTTVVIA